VTKMMTTITFWRKSVSCAKTALSQFKGAAANDCRISLLSIEALCCKLWHLGAWPPNEEVFQDFPIVRGSKGMFAKPYMDPYCPLWGLAGGRWVVQSHACSLLRVPGRRDAGVRFAKS
jgi:hypothetical protein